MLFACGDNAGKEESNNEEASKEMTVENNENKLSKAEQTEWTVDERLQEPTEEVTCFMCNMKVYTKDHEQGIFSAQAVRENGEIVFYDDIGCLLNDEYANGVENEKFVRDYHTLNWFNVEEAYAVKTDLKSPMNWGYIFFKFEDDANAYIAENENAELVAIEDIRTQAMERYKKKQMNSEGHNHQSDKDTMSSDGSPE